jgi:hypothetical protein
MGKVIEFPKNVGDESKEPACRMSEWLYVLYSHILDQQERLVESKRQDLIADMDNVFSLIPAEVIDHLNQRYGQEHGIDWQPDK